MRKRGLRECVAEHLVAAGTVFRALTNAAYGAYGPQKQTAAVKGDFIDLATTEASWVCVLQKPEGVWLCQNKGNSQVWVAFPGPTVTTTTPASGQRSASSRPAPQITRPPDATDEPRERQRHRDREPDQPSERHRPPTTGSQRGCGT